MKKDDAVGELSRILEKLGAAGGDALEGSIAATVRALKAGHKVLVFGNGGSAAEAQHFAAELMNRFLKERRAIPSIALTTDTSALTAISNDRSFDQVFSRQIEAIGDKGDVAIALTTSGNSPNIIEALKAAKAKGMLTIALTGEGGGMLASTSGVASDAAPDYLIAVPSESTPRIQEVHLLMLHIMAEEIETGLY
jgi:D-sedoheptulose 7-phosphate isomerase